MAAARTTKPDIRHVRVDVVSTSKPEETAEHHTYKCDADIRISEGDDEIVSKARLTVHHPRGWMGVAAGFDFDIDASQYPTFEARAERACLQTIDEFPADDIISVFLLGSGRPQFGEG